MKQKIVLKKIKVIFRKIEANYIWQKMFIHRIDEEKMREYQNQHRLMNLTKRNF